MLFCYMMSLVSALILTIRLWPFSIRSIFQIAWSLTSSSSQDIGVAPGTSFKAIEVAALREIVLFKLSEDYFS